MQKQRQEEGKVLRWATYFGLLGGFLGILSVSNRVDPDLFHEMSLFREALVMGRIPTQDVFAYTPTVTSRSIGCRLQMETRLP